MIKFEKLKRNHSFTNDLNMSSGAVFLKNPNWHYVARVYRIMSMGSQKTHTINASARQLRYKKSGIRRRNA